MESTRRVAAAAAITAFLVPFAVTTALTAQASDVPARHGVSLVVDPQSYTVASAARHPDVARAVFESYTPPPPPAAAAQPAATSEAQETSSTSSISAQAFSGEAVVDYASQFVGVVPYGLGNDPSDSFSCDGFVQYVFGHFGISLPRGADYQAALGTVIPASEARAGDLIWYPGRHIGIYDGAGGVIDSPDWGRFVEHHATWPSSGTPVYVRL